MIEETSTSNEDTKIVKKETFLKYLEIGISVFPCDKYKKPVIKSWLDYQKRLATVEEVNEWYRTHKNIDAIAMCTGYLSGVCVVDIDNVFDPCINNNIDNTINVLLESCGHKTEKTLKKITSFTPRGGQHWWFKTPEVAPSNSTNSKHHVDIRGEGGYVLLPPSIAYDKTMLKKQKYVEGKYTFEKEITSLSEAIKSLEELPSGILKFLSTSSSKLSTEVHKRGNMSTAVHSFFKDGQRDNDLFKVGMSLIDGNCNVDLARECIKRLALSCGFDEAESQVKVDSALKREGRKHENLTEEIREWVMSTDGLFLSTDVHRCLQLSTRQEMKNCAEALRRLVDKGILEKDKKQNGKWRKKDVDETVMDLNQEILPTVDIWLPCNLHNIASLRPKNIMVIAGVSNTGKTAWLLNIARNNKNVYYFNSEMEIGELKEKLSSFEGGIKYFNHVTFLERSSNFSDVIRPDAINIIDFLEIHEEHYKMGLLIKEIHDRLGKGVCIIAIQKDKNKDFGVGGVSTLEKARLYINLDNEGSYQKAKIIKAKIIKDRTRNPNQAEMNYWITKGGTKIEPKSQWKNVNYEYPSIDTSEPPL
jgi:hypothetical protein